MSTEQIIWLVGYGLFVIFVASALSYNKGTQVGRKEGVASEKAFQRKKHETQRRLDRQENIARRIANGLTNVKYSAIVFQKSHPEREVTHVVRVFRSQEKGTQVTMAKVEVDVFYIGNETEGIIALELQGDFHSYYTLSDHSVSELVKELQGLLKVA